MGSPRGADAEILEDKASGDKRDKGCSVEVKRSVQHGFGRHTIIEARGAYKVDREIGLIENVIPQLERELGVKAAQDSHKVVSPCADGKFGSVCLVQMGRQELEFDYMLCHNQLSWLSIHY